MSKKTHHHSLHWSDEIETIVRANMERVGARTLNSYVEFLALGHESFLRRCDTAADMANEWRKFWQIIEDEKKLRGK